MEKDLSEKFQAAFSLAGLQFSLPGPIDSQSVKLISGRVLAYIGDSVFELAIRLRHFLILPQKNKKIHGTVVQIVCADNQAKIFDEIFDLVNPEEKDLLRYWRNMKLPRKSLMPRLTYAKSTSFEAFIGYLFLTGQNERIQYLIQKACDSALEMDCGLNEKE